MNHLSRSSLLLIYGALISLMLACNLARADQPQLAIPALSTHLENNVGAGVQGRAALNIAAGAENMQANTAVIAPDGVAQVRSYQTARVASVPATSASHIDAHVFQHAQGVLSLNLASGIGNAQNNIVAVARTIEIETVADSMLHATTAQRSRIESPVITPPSAQASRHTDAFAGASGVLQVNQTAGSGNVTSNIFVLRPPAGTFF
jgi:hypothetical protein